MSPKKKVAPAKAPARRAAKAAPAARAEDRAPDSRARADRSTPPARASVELSLTGFEVDPDVVTSRLGVVPSAVLRAGEPLAPDSPIESKVNAWTLTAEQADPSEPLHDVLTRLLSGLDLEQVGRIRETFGGGLEVAFRPGRED